MNIKVEEPMSRTGQLKFSGIKEPEPVALIFLKGGGTKLFHSYLDSHPELYAIPGFPLLYFYPHWQQWQEQFQDIWEWDTIINIFCIKHASVLDSGKLIGLSGLSGLGEEKNENIKIDAEEFRRILRSLLRDEPIKRRTFLLAVHYAYALCKGEDIGPKKVLLWHHHAMYYLDDFIEDFPDAIILGMIRDPRPKIYSMYKQDLKTDVIKLNLTDAMIYRCNVLHLQLKNMFILIDTMLNIKAPAKVFAIRHEDLASELPRVMQGVADLMGIRFVDSMLESTFDGKLWWGHEIHSMPDVSGYGGETVKKMSQEALKRVISTSWQKEKPIWEIFVFEGLDHDYLVKYGYTPLYYKKDSWLERMFMLIAVWFPYQMEIQDTLFYLNPSNHVKIIETAWQEAIGKLKRKYYGFNATYLFKYSYQPYRLWDRRPIICWLDHAEKNKNKSAVACICFMAAAVAYVLYTYLRFWAAIITLPFLYLRRVGMFYYIFLKRLFRGSYLAPQIWDNV